MKTLLIILLTLISVSVVSAQSGTPSFSWDDSYHYHNFMRDSCSATDSNFVRYVPAHNEYYRGFFVSTYQNIGTPTFRFVMASSPVTSIDSTVTAASAIGQNTVFTSRRTYPKTALTAGTVYLLEFIGSSNQPCLRPQGAIITSDR